MSAGAMLFAFGTEGYRYMAPDASLMFHEVAGFTCGKIEEIKADATQLDLINKSIFEKISLHIGKDKNYLIDIIKSKHHADWFLTCKEALKHNIANKIKNPNINIDISLNISLD